MMLLTAPVSLSFLHANIRLMEIMPGYALPTVVQLVSSSFSRWLSLNIHKPATLLRKRLLRAVGHFFLFLLILSNILIIVKQSPSIWKHSSLHLWCGGECRVSRLSSDCSWSDLLKTGWGFFFLREWVLNQTLWGISQHHPHCKQLNRVTHGCHYWHDCVASWFNATRVRRVHRT